jgi:hypothetical protein
MRKIVVVIVALMLSVPAVFAQSDNDKNHGEIGVFADMFRLNHAKTNFVGVGGRVGFNVHPNVQIEAEMNYDFERNFSTDIPLPGGTPNTFVRSNVRLVHGLFGPKFQVGTGALRAFVTAKGGFLNFSTDKNLAGQFSGIPNGDTNGVFYPGGGIEAYAGNIGIRIEAGDEIYWDRGANHNFRISGGPQFRF